jgi:hypothetical protein
MGHHFKTLQGVYSNKLMPFGINSVLEMKDTNSNIYYAFLQINSILEKKGTYSKLYWSRLLTCFPAGCLESKIIKGEFYYE